MTNAQSTSNEYIEVELSIELTYHRPTTKDDGKLTFTEFRPNEALSCFKCKVPKDAIKDKETLTEYVREQMYDCDVIGLDQVNIWDEDASERGEFRFPY